jgi:hypothetical protein
MAAAHAGPPIGPYQNPLALAPLNPTVAVLTKYRGSCGGAQLSPSAHRYADREPRRLRAGPAALSPDTVM